MPSGGEEEEDEEVERKRGRADSGELGRRGVPGGRRWSWRRRERRMREEGERSIVAAGWSMELELGFKRGLGEEGGMGACRRGKGKGRRRPVGLRGQ